MQSRNSLNETGDRAFSCESAIARVVFYLPTIMTNLSKHKPPRWQTPKSADYPVHRHNGTDYRIVPESTLTKLMSDKDGFFWIAIGMGCTVIAAVTHLVISAMTPPAAATNQPTVIEKPIVVTQEKIVPTSCIAFCNR